MEILQVVPNPDISPVLFHRNLWLYVGVAVRIVGQGISVQTFTDATLG